MTFVSLVVVVARVCRTTVGVSLVVRPIEVLMLAALIVPCTLVASVDIPSLAIIVTATRLVTDFSRWWNDDGEARLRNTSVPACRVTLLSIVLLMLNVSNDDDMVSSMLPSFLTQLVTLSTHRLLNNACDVLPTVVSTCCMPLVSRTMWLPVLAVKMLVMVVSCVVVCVANVLSVVASSCVVLLFSDCVFLTLTMVAVWYRVHLMCRMHYYVAACLFAL